MAGPNVEVKRELQKMNKNLDKLNDNLKRIINDDNPNDKEQLKGQASSEDDKKLKEPMQEKFKCNECEREFNSRNGLNAHMRSHKD